MLPNIILLLLGATDALATIVNYRVAFRVNPHEVAFMGGYNVVDQRDVGNIVREMPEWSSGLYEARIEEDGSVQVTKSGGSVATEWGARQVVAQMQELVKANALYPVHRAGRIRKHGK